MNVKHLLFFLLSIFCFKAFPQLTKEEKELVAPSVSLSQDLNYFLKLNFQTLKSSEDNLPFWLYRNKRGRLSPDSNISAWITSKAVTFFTPESYMIVGAGILYQDGFSKGVVADELFAHFQNSWMYITAGRKQKAELYNGLSSSNESILWSVNARPMPGIQIGTSRPIYLFSDEGFGFEGSWNEYWMGNDRYTEGARAHHKYLRLVYSTGNWQVKFGLRHIGQWAGNFPQFGKQPDSFRDYIKIITGQGGGAEALEGEQTNALGNHLGSYEIFLTKDFRNFEIQLLYNHLFEDGSGRRLGNTPDGRYGIYYQSKDDFQFINSAIYEFYYTHHQSHTTTGKHKYDDYFNHWLYQSGWTYENRVIGAPFFMEDEEEPGFNNNKFSAHHLGIGGQFSNYFGALPYKLLLSYARNEGTYKQRITPHQNVFYTFFEVGLLQEAIDINLQLGIEYNSYTSPIYGAGVHLVYKL